MNKKITLTILSLGIIALAAVLLVSTFPRDTNLNTNYSRFSSEAELAAMLKQTSSLYNSYGAESAMAPTTGAKTSSLSSDSSSGRDYSTTNIQVEGVDEPDIVKNDDKYIYVASGSNISIIEAYPSENAAILSTINLANSSAEQIFINGDKLVVFGRENYYYTPFYDAKCAADKCFAPQLYRAPKSFVYIYDISNKENPELYNSFIYDGSYYDSRMIGNYVYLIANQPIDLNNDSVVMPTITLNSRESAMAVTDVYNIGFYDYSYQLTSVFAMDINDKDSLTKKSFLTGYTGTIYVSQENIYLTSQKYVPYEQTQLMIIERVLIPLVDSPTAEKIKDVLSNSSMYSYEKQGKINSIFESYYNKLPESEKKDLQTKLLNMSREIESEIAKENDKTIVHRIEIDGNSIEYNGRGEFPGHLLNQFSLDENEGYLRVATTAGQAWNGNSLNNIYVLNKDLEIVGKVEDLAKGESIYSVRFMGDRAYMVTFVKIDPLFVIDLSDPESPKVLGELKIPGFSDYLHPYDENHVIGIGKNAIAASDSETQTRGIDFAWYQGIKLSLFDVTDVNNPKEVSNFNIGDRGTDSEALYEHKAFLFDKEKSLLVIPISLHEIDSSKYQGSVPSYAYGDLKFIGAYVFNLDLENGFQLKGRVSHLNESQLSSLQDGDYYGYDYNAQIRRSLYIDDTLYTLSNSMLKANSLTDLNETASIKLPVETYGPVLYTL